MTGIFTQAGVAAVNAANAEGPNQTTNCADTLFYATDDNCRPRFDPSAMNALISEIVAVVNKAGVTYDCASVENLTRAVCAIGAVSTATTGVNVPNGAIIVSSDTGTPYYNSTGATVLVAGTTDTDLIAQGFTGLGSSAVATVAPAGGVDGIGEPYSAGDLLLTLAGTTYAVERKWYVQTAGVVPDAATLPVGMVWNNTTSNITSRNVLDAGNNRVWEQI